MKKVMSIVLAVVMLFSTVLITAAETSKSEESVGIAKESEATAEDERVEIKTDDDLAFTGTDKALSEIGVEYTYGDYKYTVSNGVATVTGYTGSSTSISIPSSVNGYTVRTIGERAFSGKTKIEYVFFPNTLNTIKAYAFESCTRLAEVSIPNSVTTIGGGAFRNCTRIQELTIGSGLEKMDYYTENGAFQGCISLKTVTILYGSKVIGNYAFKGCTSLTSISIPNTVKAIGNRAFSNCSSLSGVTIPNSVESIGEYAFSDCKLISSFSIGNSVAKIGAYAFENCKNITKVSIPNSVTTIGGGAFRSCTGIKELTIGSGLEKMDYYTENGAFQGCTSLKTVTIASGALKIGSYAFKDCTSLTSIYVPDSVLYIGGVKLNDDNLKDDNVFKNHISSLTIYGNSGSFAEKFAKANNIKFNTQQTIVYPISVFLSRTSLTMNKGATQTITASVYPTNATYKTVTWKSENENVATVYKGTITANGIGKTYITASTVNGKSAKCEVIVETGSTQIIYPTSISLNKSSITMGVSETYSLTASISPSNATQKSVSWSSSNTSIATVSSSGKLTAKAVGTATITASTSNGKKATCAVTVKKAPTSVSLNKTSITLGVGEQYDFDSSLPSGCAAYSIVYTSSDTSVCTVKASGGIATAKAVGTATITATAYNGKKVSCAVTVKRAPTSVSLNKTTLTLGVGEQYDLDSSVPSGSAAHSIVYSSSNTSVCTVKASGGIVTAKAVGSAVISATTYNGKRISCVVTVKKAPTSVSLNKTSITLGIGEQFDFDSSVPSGSAAHSIVYSSSNTSVCTVKASGGIATAMAVGTSTITATAYNGKKVSCTVTVKKAPTSVSLNKTSLSLKVGGQYDLDSSLPSGCAAYKIVYSSSNTSVCSVRASGGIVTALKAGKATITATAYNGKKVTCSVTVTN